jgi:DNA-binding MarR family transcriptional regulator
MTTLLSMRPDLTELFDEVRLLEHLLARAAEGLHRSSGISVPGRAVLEFLERNGPTPVPNIARARYVTRQHIQTIVDTLTDQKLVGRAPNAGHRSSPLITLTDAGAHAIDKIHEREDQILDRAMTAIGAHDVRAATSVLTAVREALDQTEAA